jgi:hypothetical protein
VLPGVSAASALCVKRTPLPSARRRIEHGMDSRRSSTEFSPRRSDGSYELSRAARIERLKPPHNRTT